MAASGSTAAGKKFRQTGASADAQNRFAVATGNGCIGATSGTGGGGEAPICHAVSKTAGFGRAAAQPANLCRNTNELVLLDHAIKRAREFLAERHPQVSGVPTTPVLSPTQMASFQ